MKTNKKNNASRYSTGKNPTQRNYPAQKASYVEISRMFSGMPVVDAKNDLRVSILDADIKKGKPKDFDGCVFAEACKRLFSSQKVLLMRTVAYISLPDEKGNYRVERFQISNEGMKLIADFDRGIMPKPKTSFVFNAPTPSRTLDGKSDQEKRSRKLKREVKIHGEITGNGTTNNHKQIKTSEQIIDVRNGSGLIQMSRLNEKRKNDLRN